MRLLLLPFVLVVLLIGKVVSQEKLVRRAPHEQERPDQRIALLIGNAAYTTGDKLRNPVNDVNDLDKVLREDLKFDTEVIRNEDRNDIIKAIRRFGEKLKKGGMGLFFYSGHGLQAGGRKLHGASGCCHQC